MNPERINDGDAGAQGFQPAARLRGIEKSMIRQLFDRALPGSINLGLGEPDLPTPAVIRRAAVRVIEEERNGYTAHAGLAPLRALVAADYPQLKATPDDVIITAGSQEALYLALMTIVDAGDEVLLPDPGFVAYPTIVRMCGGRPTFYRLPARDGFAFDAEDFRRRLTPRTKAVVCISPSNPTGRTLSRAELTAMADALGDSSAYIISDEIYREIYFDDERPASVSEERAARAVVIGGLSKSMSMTGWRTGWMCGAPEVVRSALVLHGYVTTCASTISQKAALAAWTDEAEAARAETRRIFRARRDQLLSLIANELKLQAIAPDGAFYLMLDVSAYGSSLEVAEQLLAHGVITVPGSAFGAEGEGYLRLSFCADAPTLAEGVSRIKTALGRQRPEVRG
ncbi:MAG TPA: aminotransferase class I/II-fold pyridoxal phosphate-dependent enzyme [Pyrinomonadaceae bacterium]|nr:aminotransferase class I/II-fold pyridoxal phosphate-dependent enzyme [Pyrinomonadaceae bacterium]